MGTITKIFVAIFLISLFLGILSWFFLYVDVQTPDKHPTALCDLNFDGRCDCADLIIFQKALGSCIRSNSDYDKNYDPRADMDGDGCVTASDKTLLLSFASSSFAACASK